LVKNIHSRFLKQPSKPGLDSTETPWYVRSEKSSEYPLEFWREELDKISREVIIKIELYINDRITVLQDPTNLLKTFTII
jgi:hypothetical protein